MTLITSSWFSWLTASQPRKHYQKQNQQQIWIGQQGSAFPDVPVSSDLWDLVIFSNWEQVLHHVKVHPNDAQWTDGHYHESVLYLACQHNPPVYVIEAILDAYHAAPIIRNSREHDFPIHIACQYQLDSAVLRALVKDHPQTAVEQTRWGRTPLTNLWLSKQKQVQQQQQQQQQHQHQDDGTTVVPIQEDNQFWDKVMILLNAVARFRCYRGTETATNNGAVQMGGMIRRVDIRTIESHNVDVVSDCFIASPPSRGDDDDDDDDDDQHIADSRENDDSSLGMEHGIDVGTEWCALTDKNIDDTIYDNSFVVHAAVSLGALYCPMGVLEYVLNHFPDQVFSRDTHGQLPLHVAIAQSSWNEATRHRYRPREKDFIMALLKVYPDAAKEPLLLDTIDDDDDDEMNRDIARYARYPLHIALVNRHLWSGGIQELFYAAPDIVMIQDPITMLYPFQLAAVVVPSPRNESCRDDTTKGSCSTSSCGVDLETIYRLLRSRPEIIHRFIVDNGVEPTINQRYQPTATYCDKDGQQQQEIKRRIQRKNTTAKNNQCPSILQETLLGTATALLIGSVVGTIFSAI
jgi:hypothetical protein